MFSKIKRVHFEEIKVLKINIDTYQYFDMKVSYRIVFINI